jgi:hypothetical protein
LLTQSPRPARISEIVAPLAWLTKFGIFMSAGIAQRSLPDWPGLQSVGVNAPA